jgi:hypothetical protein
MSITVIKEGNILRILQASEPLPENTPIELFTHAVEPWQGAQLDSAFADGEDWGPKLESLIVKEARR